MWLTKESGRAMGKLIKYVSGLFGILVAGAILVVGVKGIYLPWPTTEGELTLEGLENKVDVYRDQWGVTHLYASSDADLFLAQGYIHAQDRLWQMEFGRRIGSGTLSEVFGNFMVESDAASRLFGMRRVAENSMQVLDDDTRRYIVQYTAGVNAFLNTHQSRLPAEFMLLGFEPEPWTEVDTLMWSNTMAYFMSANYRAELLRQDTLIAINDQSVAVLFPEYESGSADLFGGKRLVDEPLGSMMPERLYQDLNGFMCCTANMTQQWGSNAWVVSGEHTESGKPLLANDTHLALSIGGGWYEMGLHSDRFDVVGYTFPGMPFVVVGHNSDIAWGLTNLNADVQDVYVEKLDNVSNPGRYLVDGEWRDLSFRSEKISVKDADPVMFDIVETHRGPLLDSLLRFNDPFRFGYKKTDSPSVSLAWTMKGSSTTLQGIARLNRASNWDEFRSALSHWDTLSQNMLYADTKGNIGQQAAGRVPVRAEGHEGSVPVDGTDSRNDWIGFLPFDALPYSYNPASGILVAANHDITDRTNDGESELAESSFITHDWDPGYRAHRIHTLIEETLLNQGKMDILTNKNIQNDVYSVYADNFIALLADIKPASENGLKAHEAVLTWDQFYRKDSVGAAIFDAWYLQFVDNLLRDDFLESDADHVFKFYKDMVNFHVPALLRIIDGDYQDLVDNISTPEVEDLTDIATRSFSQAVAYLEDNHGSQVSQWQWGTVHSMTFKHSPFGNSGIKPLEWLFNSDTVPAEGSWFTVNLAHYSWEFPFLMNFGTSQRMVVDTADWDSMQSVGTTGQSGLVFHDNRTDQLSLWSSAKYRDLPFSKNAVTSASDKRLLILSP